MKVSLDRVGKNSRKYLANSSYGFVTRATVGILLVTFSPIQNSFAQDAPQPKKMSAFAKAEATALSKIKAVLKELRPDTAGKIVMQPDDGDVDSEKEQKASPAVVVKSYKLQHSVTPQPRFIGTVTVYLKANGSYNFLLQFAQAKPVADSKEPDWQKIEQKLDTFVKRQWPQLKRSAPIQKAMSEYLPMEGVFHLPYTLKLQGIDLTTLTLDVSLGDGSISSINYFDRSTAVHDFLAGKPLPAAPTRETMLEAIRKAISEKGDSREVAVLRTLTDLRIKNVTRNFGRMPFPSKQLDFFNDIQVSALTKKKVPVIFAAGYAEASKAVSLGDIMDDHDAASEHSDGHLHSTNDATKLDKPLTRVADTHPKWQAGGKTLSFLTTRDVAGRPWWQRDSIVVSAAQWNTSGVTLIRPVKAQFHDFASYATVAISPSGIWQAMTLPDQENKVIFLELNGGKLYFPYRTDSQLSAWRGAEEGAEQPSEPIGLADGFAWLSESNGLVASVSGDRDLNLYALSWEKGASPTKLEFVPVVVQTGDDIIPCIGNDGNSLAWAHDISVAPEKSKSNEPARWEFAVADISQQGFISKVPQLKPGQQVDPKVELSRLNAINRRTVELPGRPESISWDSRQKRWLVVTEEGSVIWIAESDGKLLLEVAPKLMWGEETLKPQSADVNPRTGEIAISALLPTPKLFSKSECVVIATIFVWDGKSKKAVPLFDSSLNKLDRYNFPITKSPYAHIIGRPESTGLEGLADPAYFSAGQ